MKRFFLSLFYCGLVTLYLLTGNTYGATITSRASGNWNSTLTWQGGQVPGPTSDVIIASGHNITLNINTSCLSLRLAVGTQHNFAVGTYNFSVTNGITIEYPNTGNNVSTYISVTTGNLSCGSLSILTSSNNKRTSYLTIGAGTVTVPGNITMAGDQTTNWVIFTGAGTLNIGGSISGGDLRPATNSIVNFNGTSPSGQIIPINANYVYYHINTNNIYGTTLGGIITTSNVTGNISVVTGSFYNGGYAIASNGKTLTVSDGASFILTGTSGFPTGFATVSLGATSTVIYNGGVQTVAGVASPGYGNLEISGAGAKTAGGNFQVQSNFTIDNGAVFEGGTYTFTSLGAWINNGSFAEGASNVIFSGTSPQMIEGANQTTFNTLTINNSSGVSILTDENVKTTLSFTSGKISTGVHSLILSGTATVSGAGATSYVNGNLNKGIDLSTLTKTFEIGDASSYTPVTLTFENAITTGGSMTMSSTAGDHPQINSCDIIPSKSVNRYWTIANSGVSGFNTYSVIFNFVAGDVDPGASPSLFIIENYYSSVWYNPLTGTTTATSTEATAVSRFGDFQIGESKGKRIFQSAVSGPWNEPSTWETSRNGTIWIPSPTYPTHNDSVIRIRSPHTVTVTQDVGRDTVDEVIIDAGAKLVEVVNPSGWWLYFRDGPGTDLTINGTFEYQDDQLQLLSGATMVVNSGGKFSSNLVFAGNYPITIPTATWDVNSTCEILSSNQLAIAGGLNQSFGNFTWDCAGQTSVINLAGVLKTVNGNLTINSTGTSSLQLTNTTALTLNVGGNLNISGGSVDFASGAAATKVLNLGGNFNQTGGTFTNSNSNILTINFTGSGKTFTKSAGTLTSTYINFVVAPAASLALQNDLVTSAGRSCTVNGTLDCGVTSRVSGTGSFILNDNATLIMGDPNGITSSGANGNIQTSTRTFGTNASYTYNGTGAQITGSGLPVTSIKNLTIANSAGVTLSGNVMIQGTLALNGGVLITGSNTLGFRTGDIPISRITGTISVSPDGNIEFGDPTHLAGAAFVLPAGIFTTDPAINNFSIYRTNSLTLNNQMLSVRGTVLSNGPLITGGNLTLLSDATQTALIDGAGTGSVAGNVTIQRYLPSKLGYKYLSSPFQSGTVGMFSPYIDLGGAFPTFYKYDENRTATGWITYNSPASSLSVLEGYAGNFGPSAGTLTMSVSGAVNNGLQSKTFYNHNFTYTQGFNLAGNPYPSPVDWNAASGWTKTNIENALYYFNASDEYNGTYSTYINGVSSDGIASNIIAAMQGFFIHVSTGSYPVTGSLGMTNAVRVNNLNPVFHKSIEADEKPFIRFSASFADSKSVSDPSVIYLQDDANPAFEQDKDALKLFNTDKRYPNLYSLTSKKEKLSINACSLLTDSIVSVPLGISVSHDGFVTFRVDEIKNMDGDNYTYLYDSRLKIFYELKTGYSKSFNLDEGDNEGRFSIVLCKNRITDTPPFSCPLKAYGVSGKILIFVNIQKEEEGDLVIYNITGQPVWKEKIHGEMREEAGSGFPSGVYIVTLTTKTGHYSSKVFTRN